MKVYGDTISIEVVPTTSSASTAYAAGDQFGAIQTLTVAASSRPNSPVVLKSVTVIDKSNQKPAFDIVFFKTVPTLVADNAAADITDADAITALGIVNVAVTDYASFTSNALASVKNINLVLAPNSGTAGDIWASVICRTASTMTTNAAVKFVYSFSRDS